jgi:hypothetical protein
MTKPSKPLSAKARANIDAKVARMQWAQSTSRQNYLELTDLQDLIRREVSRQMAQRMFVMRAK